MALTPDNNWRPEKSPASQQAEKDAIEFIGRLRTGQEDPADLASEYASNADNSGDRFDYTFDFGRQIAQNWFGLNELKKVPQSARLQVDALGELMESNLLATADFQQMPSDRLIILYYTQLEQSNSDHALHLQDVLQDAMLRRANAILSRENHGANLVRIRGELSILGMIDRDQIDQALLPQIDATRKELKDILENESIKDVSDEEELFSVYSRPLVDDESLLDIPFNDVVERPAEPVTKEQFEEPTDIEEDDDDDDDSATARTQLNLSPVADHSDTEDTGFEVGDEDDLDPLGKNDTRPIEPVLEDIPRDRAKEIQILDRAELRRMTLEANVEKVLSNGAKPEELNAVFLDINEEMITNPPPPRELYVMFYDVMRKYINSAGRRIQIDKGPGDIYSEILPATDDLMAYSSSIKFIAETSLAACLAPPEQVQKGVGYFTGEAYRMFRQTIMRKAPPTMPLPIEVYRHSLESAVNDLAQKRQLSTRVAKAAVLQALTPPIEVPDYLGVGEPPQPIEALTLDLIDEEAQEQLVVNGISVCSPSEFLVLMTDEAFDHHSAEYAGVTKDRLNNLSVHVQDKIDLLMAIGGEDDNRVQDLLINPLTAISETQTIPLDIALEHAEVVFVVNRLQRTRDDLYDNYYRYNHMPPVEVLQEVEDMNIYLARHRVPSHDLAEIDTYEEVVELRQLQAEVDMRIIAEKRERREERTELQPLFNNRDLINVVLERFRQYEEGNGPDTQVRQAQGRLAIAQRRRQDRAEQGEDYRHAQEWHQREIYQNILRRHLEAARDQLGGADLDADLYERVFFEMAEGHSFVPLDYQELRDVVEQGFYYDTPPGELAEFRNLEIGMPTDEFLQRMRYEAEEQVRVDQYGVEEEERVETEPTVFNLVHETLDDRRRDLVLWLAQHQSSGHEPRRKIVTAQIGQIDEMLQIVYLDEYRRLQLQIDESKEKWESYKLHRVREQMLMRGIMIPEDENTKIANPEQRARRMEQLESRRYFGNTDKIIFTGGDAEVVVKFRQDLRDGKAEGLAAAAMDRVLPGSHRQATFPYLIRIADTIGMQYEQYVKQAEDSGMRGPRPTDLIRQAINEYWLVGPEINQLIEILTTEYIPENGRHVNLRLENVNGKPWRDVYARLEMGVRMEHDNEIKWAIQEEGGLTEEEGFQLGLSQEHKLRLRMADEIEHAEEAELKHKPIRRRYLSYLTTMEARALTRLLQNAERNPAIAREFRKDIRTVHVRLRAKGIPRQSIATRDIPPVRAKQFERANQIRRANIANELGQLIEEQEIQQRDERAEYRNDFGELVDVSAVILDRLRGANLYKKGSYKAYINRRNIINEAIEEFGVQPGDIPILHQIMDQEMRYPSANNTFDIGFFIRQLQGDSSPEGRLRLSEWINDYMLRLQADRAVEDIAYTEDVREVKSPAQRLSDRLSRNRQPAEPEPTTRELRRGGTDLDAVFLYELDAYLSDQDGDTTRLRAAMEQLLDYEVILQVYTNDQIQGLVRGGQLQDFLRAIPEDAPLDEVRSILREAGRPDLDALRVMNAVRQHRRTAETRTVQAQFGLPDAAALSQWNANGRAPAEIAQEFRARNVRFSRGQLHRYLRDMGVSDLKALEIENAYFSGS